MVKPLNSGHLLVLKNLSVIKRCLLLGGSLTKIVTFGTKHFVRCSRHVRYREVSLYLSYGQKLLVDSIVKSQFTHWPLIGMFCSRTLNNSLNHIHHDKYNSSLFDFLEKLSIRSILTHFVINVAFCNNYCIS